MATDDVLRKNRGLGMLLASIGGNKDKEASNNGMVPAVIKMKPEKDQGFAPESSGFSSWDDISSKPNVGGPVEEKNISRHGKSGNTSAGPKKERHDNRKITKEFRDEDVYGPKDMNRWSDIKEYDDNHDRQWFDEENARLAKQYGGNFIYAKYLESQPGRVGYYCQLCCAEMNARKSLELHCNGMKHLKRKDQWEKGEQDQGEHGENSGGVHEKGGPRQSNRWPAKDPYRPPANSWSDRGQPRRDSYGGHGPQQERGPYRGTLSSDYRNEDRGHPDRRDDYGRYSDNYYDDYYRKEPYRPAFDRDPYDGRGSSDMRHDYDRNPGPARRDAGERYPQERFNPYSRRQAPPPPVISNPSRFDRGGVPCPPMINDLNLSTPLFEGIADGSCSELLKKLSVCRVKNVEDAALARNVAGFLVLSLKDYYSKVGPATIAHILDEIVLKMNIMKDLLK